MDVDVEIRLRAILADHAVSEYVKAAVLLLKEDAAQYNCRIRLPIAWKDLLRNIDYLQTLLQEDLFFYLAQAIDSRYFLSTARFTRVEDIVKSRLEAKECTFFEPVYCCGAGSDVLNQTIQQEGFTYYFKLQALPMKVQVVKANYSHNISEFNTWAMTCIRKNITRYARYLFELNGIGLDEYLIFEETYLIISEYHPGQNLVLKLAIVERSYEHLVDVIDQLQLKTFNRNYFIAEIIGCHLNLWVCYYSELRAHHLELVYGVDVSLVCNDAAYYQFSSRLAMYIELARLEFCSWRLPTVDLVV